MQITPPFGRLLTAMVTPFTKSGEIDWAGVEKIAAHLVATGHDGIAVNGTTGEAPTTSDDEKDQIVKAVRKVVGDKIKIVARAGNNETSHSVEQAQRAAKAGADVVAVIRTTGQSLLDFVPYGPTTEGFGGTYATQENFKIMRNSKVKITFDKKNHTTVFHCNQLIEVL